MAAMKCVRITIIMKMGPAAVGNITINTVPSAGMSTTMSRNTSTAMTKRAAAAKLILMKNMNMMPAAVKNMSTIITVVVVVMNMSTTTNIRMAKAVVVVNIITVITFRVTRMIVSAKSAIRTKNTVMFAAKALKTAPAVCRTLTA